VQFDQLTIVLLTRRSDASQLSAEGVAALQDAHMAHLADLHDAGHLLSAGPLSEDEVFRGLCIFNVGPEQARELIEQDPAVLAGRLSAMILTWMVPGGAMSFASTRFPRSVAEIAGD